jgi:hypothetical protein
MSVAEPGRDLQLHTEYLLLDNPPGPNVLTEGIFRYRLHGIGFLLATRATCRYPFDQRNVTRGYFAQKL